ncbi:MAG: hypothetical protein IT304_12310 [Dehalococcoidia bacterium]|nr:hypothetical protein [Dehalococcoidia bacterium]
MTDFLRLLVVFLAAINPAGVAFVAAAWTPERGRRVVLATGGLLAEALVLAAVFGADGLLDFLEVAPESFRLAAGIVLLVVGVQVLWGLTPSAAAGAGLSAGLFPFAIPLLAGPATLAAAVSHSVDDGEGVTLAAAGLALAVALALALQAPAAPRVLDGLSRLTGGLLVVVAAGLMVSGVRAI